jgi:hypothetical protein
MERNNLISSVMRNPQSPNQKIVLLFLVLLVSGVAGNMLFGQAPALVTQNATANIYPLTFTSNDQRRIEVHFTEPVDILSGNTGSVV